jgi:hypothetical protein
MNQRKGNELEMGWQTGQYGEPKGNGQLAAVGGRGGILLAWRISNGKDLCGKEMDGYISNCGNNKSTNQVAHLKDHHAKTKNGINGQRIEEKQL